MATVVLQFQVNAGAVSTGVATVVAEDEIDLRLASYSGLQSIRYEIQASPAGFAQPTGWSTDVSSGAYYFNASPIVGLTPPTITMPTSAEISAGQWGKWIFRAIGTTSTGTITSDPRCGVKIVSPALGLNGIAFSEEDEFDATRAYPGELQEDLVEIDGAALVSGGFVGSLAATAPIKVDAATGAVTASWLATGNVTMSGYGWTSCTGVTNAGGAVAITAGGGAASLAGSTTATVSANGGALLLEGATTATLNATTGALSCTGATTAAITATAGALTCTGGTTAALTASGGNLTLDASASVLVGGTSATLVALGRSGQTVRHPALAGVGTRFVTVDANGDEGVTAGGGASATARYLTDAATAINANDIPIQDLAGGLVFACDADAPVRLRRDDASGTGTLDVLVVGRTNSAGGGAITIGTGVRWDIHDADETQVEGARISAVATDVTGGAHAAKIVFEGADAGSLSTLGWWDADGLHVSTDLIVAGTTTTVDSTSVTVADRLVVFNSSTGTVPVPASAAGFVIDRGSADGVTKRDAPGVLWDEANSRFAIAYNTALDQSTIGTYVTVKVGGLISPSLDNPSGAVAVGASATSVTVTPDTTFSGTVTKTGTALTTTVVPGFVATNTTAATAGVTVQNGHAYVSSGSGWESGGGGSAKTVRAGFAVQPVSSGSIGLNYRLVTDVGTGTLAFVNTYYTTSVPGLGGSAWTSQTFVAWSDIGNGYRLITTGGTEYGALKVSGNSTVLEGKRNQADGRTEVWSNITTGSTDDGARIWNYAGTRTAGNLLAVGDGASWTQRWAVGYDGRTVTPRVISAADAPLSAGGATTFDFSRAANIEHRTTEDTTVSFANLAAHQSGTIVFIQGATGRTITMPAASGTIKYSTALAGLGVTAMVDTTATFITIMHYRITAGGVILIHGREVLPS